MLKKHAKKRVWVKHLNALHPMHHNKTAESNIVLQLCMGEFGACSMQLVSVKNFDVVCGQNVAALLVNWTIWIVKMRLESLDMFSFVGKTTKDSHI